MIKKLLITLLVLCMASSANAVQLSLIADEHEPIARITGYLDQDLYIVLTSNGDPYNFQLGPDAPDCSLIWPDLLHPCLPPGFEYLIPSGHKGEIFIMLSCGPGEYPIIDGEYALAWSQVGDVAWAAWFDESGNYGMMGDVILVPEPMTIALLGLGGLSILRRRRK